MLMPVDHAGSRSTAPCETRVRTVPDPVPQASESTSWTGPGVDAKRCGGDGATGFDRWAWPAGAWAVGHVTRRKRKPGAPDGSVRSNTTTAFCEAWYMVGAASANCSGCCVRFRWFDAPNGVRATS